MKKYEMKPEDFEIITGREETSSPISLRPGGAGLTARSSFEAAAWLASRTPREVEAGIRSRMQQHGAQFAVRREGRYPNDGDPYDVIAAVSVRLRCEEGEEIEDCRRRVLDLLAAYYVPACDQMIEQWLAELSVKVIRKATSKFDGDLLVEVYTRELRSFPADVVKSALKNAGRRKFWPTWGELEEECKRLVEFRRRLETAVARWTPRAQNCGAPADGSEGSARPGNRSLP